MANANLEPVASTKFLPAQSCIQTFLYQGLS